MIVVFLLLVLLCLYKINFKKIHEDYIDKEQTASIKGIFAIIIFLSHFRQYTNVIFAADHFVLWLLTSISQLMVTVFFFYSGYGIMKSYSKRADYSKGFFKKRLLRTLFRFDLALLFYLPLPLITGTWQYGLKDYLLCWIGWTSIGNSNWFIFVMLCLYALTWIAFNLCNKAKEKRSEIVVLFVTGMSLALWICLLVIGKASWWYNTLLCYPCGMCFALLKDRFDIWMRNLWQRIGICVTSLVVFLFLYVTPGQVAYSLCACVFCLLIVLLNISIKIDNSILRWLGKHSFNIYILQRIPMIIFKAIGLAKYGFAFLVVSLVSTLLLCVAFEYLHQWSNKMVKL